MKKHGLTRADAVKLLNETEAALKNKSRADLGDSQQLAAMKSAIMSNMDCESFDLNLGIGTAGKNLTDKVSGLDAKIMGDMDKSFNYAPTGKDIESFDAINTTDAGEIRLAAINVLSANYGSKEDGILSLFSRESIDGKEIGKEIRALAPNITINSSNINGQVIGGDKVSLISNLDDASIFGASKIKYIPVVRSTGDYKTSQFLDADLVTATTYNGEEVDTAPILVGKTISLRRLCSTTTYLNTYKDQMNPSITLAPDGGVKNVVLKLNGAAGLYNLLVLPVAGEKSTKYAPTSNSKEKEVSLSFSTIQRLNVATLLSSGVLKYTSTPSTYVLANVGPELLELDVRFTVNAKVNTDTMTFVTTGSAIELVSLYDNGTAIESTATRFTEIAAIINVGAVHAVDMNHYLSNTNNLDNGMLIDVDAERYMIPAIYRQPATINKSILADVPAEDIPGYISSAKIALNSAKATEAIDMIEEFIDGATGKTDVTTGILTNYSTDGVGANYIKPLMLSFPIDATSKISRRSGESKEDIARYIYDAIIHRAIKALADSNLSKAVDTILPNEKITLQIVATSNIASYIKFAAELDGAKEEFDVVVETSMKTGNKLYATFKIGEKVNELSPLILIETPDHVYKGTQTTANGVMDVTKVIPRRGMKINAPVLLVATVSGIVDAFVS